MVNIRTLQSRFKFMLVQLQNNAIADGKIGADERQILVGFKEMINDLPDILQTLSETTGVKPNSDNTDDVQKLLDEIFQFILAHLLDLAKKNGELSSKESELLELIAEKLETYLASYIKTGVL